MREEGSGKREDIGRVEVEVEEAIRRRTSGGQQENGRRPFEGMKKNRRTGESGREAVSRKEDRRTARHLEDDIK